MAGVGSLTPKQVKQHDSALLVEFLDWLAEEEDVILGRHVNAPDLDFDVIHMDRDDVMALVGRFMSR